MFGKTKQGPDQSVELRLSELERSIESLERRWKKVDVEWSEWFDKYRRLYARISKRQQRDEKTSEDAPQGTIFPRAGGNGSTDNPLAQRILKGL